MMLCALNTGYTRFCAAQMFTSRQTWGFRIRTGNAALRATRHTSISIRTNVLAAIARTHARAFVNRPLNRRLTTMSACRPARRQRRHHACVLCEYLSSIARATECRAVERCARKTFLS